MQPMLAKGRYFIATEMIEFQNNKFGIELETIVTQIQNKILNGEYDDAKKIRDCSELNDIVKAVKQRLGLKIRIVTNSSLAAILPFYSNKNHIFIDKFWRGEIQIKDQDKILKEAQNKKGYVNLEKAQVGGLFSEYENVLYMNFIKLVKTYKMSAPEMVGVMLHEIGHAFEICEYSDRLETTNQVLADVALRLKAKPEKQDLVYIYNELKTVNNKITEAEVEKIVSGNKIIGGYTWFKVVIGSVQQQLSNSKYDETAFEYLADNFATRFGYGRSLITALDKIHLEYGSPEKSYNSMLMAHLLSFVKGGLLIGACIGSVFLASFSPLLVFVIFIYAFLVFLSTGEEGKDYTYDELKIRYKRIRNQYIEELKSLDLQGEELKNVLNDIYLIDRIINDTYRFQSFFNVLSNFLFSVNREANKSIREQQLMEELVHNDLFLKSAEFQAIA